MRSPAISPSHQVTQIAPYFVQSAKPVQRKAGHAKHRADDSADRCGEREFENALWSIKNTLAAREAVHQPRAGYSLKCVAGRDGNRCGDVSRGR